MIALLLKLGGWITDHPKIFCLLLFLAGGLLGVLAGRRSSPPQALQEEVRTSGAAFGREDLTRKTEEGPWTRETWEYERSARGSAKKSPSQSAKDRQEAAPQAPLVLHSIESHGPTASETHASAESAQSTTQTLKLSETGYSAPQWALSVGFENLLHDRALRLSVRRKFLGPIWVEGAFTPATRAVGAGLSVEW